MTVYPPVKLNKDTVYCRVNIRDRIGCGCLGFDNRPNESRPRSNGDGSVGSFRTDQMMRGKFEGRIQNKSLLHFVFRDWNVLFLKKKKQNSSADSLIVLILFNKNNKCRNIIHLNVYEPHRPRRPWSGRIVDCSYKLCCIYCMANAQIKLFRFLLLYVYIYSVHI